MSDDLLIRMQGIDKAFPGVQALKDARFELRPGEVHALVGENGAGKSTLMKVLTGVYQKDAGTIEVKGQHVEVPNPRAGRDLGIGMIHQELLLANHLTVAQNIYLGREPRGRLGFTVDDKQQLKMTEELVERLGLKLDPTAKCGSLKVAQQQMVEIAKALSLDASVLIMDEPTAALTDTEIEELFRIIRSLREQGKGIVHISHRLEELREISDRVTVMRDGQHVDTVETKDVTIDQIIAMMVGRTIYEEAPKVPEDADQQPYVLEVKGLSHAGDSSRTSRSACARARSWASPVSSEPAVPSSRGSSSEPIRRMPARSWSRGRRWTSTAPRKLWRWVSPTSRKTASGTALAWGSTLRPTSRWPRSGSSSSRLVGSIRRRTKAAAEQRVEELDIKTPGIGQKARNLSGGNQQKVVIAKWLTAEMDILIFDEPTRGIDVGAKQEIYHLLNELAREGKSIVMISSELPEVLRMSHRILVMCEGRLTGELTADEASQKKIMTLATQRESVAAAKDVSRG